MTNCSSQGCLALQFQLSEHLEQGPYTLSTALPVLQVTKTYLEPLSIKALGTFPRKPTGMFGGHGDLPETA